MKSFLNRFLIAVIFAMSFVGVAQAQSNNVAAVVSANVQQGFKGATWQAGVDADYNFSGGFVLSNRFSVAEARFSNLGEGNTVTDALFVTKKFGSGTYRPTILVGAQLATQFNPASNNRVFIPTAGVGLNIADQFVFRAEALTRTFGDGPKASGARFTGEYFYKFGSSRFGAKAATSFGFLVVNNGFFTQTTRSYNLGGGVFYSF